MARNIKFAQSLSEDFLDCRTLRHAWQRMTIRGWVENSGDEPEVKVRWKIDWKELLVQKLACKRCGTEKFEYFGRQPKEPHKFPNIRKISVRYVYPEGYSYHSSESIYDRPALTDYYEESVQRLYLAR